MDDGYITEQKSLPKDMISILVVTKFWLYFVIFGLSSFCESLNKGLYRYLFVKKITEIELFQTPVRTQFMELLVDQLIYPATQAQSVWRIIQCWSCGLKIITSTHFTGNYQQTFQNKRGYVLILLLIMVWLVSQLPCSLNPQVRVAEKLFHCSFNPLFN